MVSSTYWYSLAAFAALGLGTRLALRRPLLPRLASPIRRWEIAIALAALIALAFHCGAMFFTDTIDSIPGTNGMESAVNELGVASKLAYALPAAVLIASLRRIWWPALIALSGALSAVGVTMYWWWGLNVHLTAIASAIGLVVLIASALIGRPTVPSGPSRALRPITPARTA